MADATSEEEVVLTNSEEEQPTVETPPAEETPAEEPQGEEPGNGEEPPAEEGEPAPAEEPPAEETPKPVSRRKELRMQKLMQLQKRLEGGEQPPAPRSKTPGLDYESTLDADPEVLKQLEADRRSYGDAQFSEGLKRAEFLDWKTSLKIDAPRVEQKYPMLDPQSDQFHPAVADSVNKFYLFLSGFDEQSNTVANANVGYADFVESYMELVDETAGNKVAQSRTNIAKQAAATGLRPDGSSTKRMNLNQAPELMSDEELDAYIATLPKKR